MKPNRRLIDALRKTALQLQDNSVYYDWTDVSNCNCGLLARNLLDIPPSYIEGAFIQALGDGHSFSWTGAAKRCNQTGLFWREIISELVEAGVELHDFQRIEYLDQINSEHAAGFSDPVQVAKWMLKEAKNLETQLVSQQAVEKVPQTVTVCARV